MTTGSLEVRKSFDLTGKCACLQWKEYGKTQSQTMEFPTFLEKLCSVILEICFKP